MPESVSADSAAKPPPIPRARYTALFNQAQEAVRVAMLTAVHPSWFKALSLKRRDEHRAAASAQTLAEVAMNAITGADLLICPKEGLPKGGAMCGLSGNYGAFMEPLACGYPKGHDGPHAFASLPTFVNGKPVPNGD